MQIILDTVPDKVDLAIINSLMQDGRKSFRQIAREIKVSTPTVESRYDKMTNIGIISNIQPIVNVEKIESHISALLFLKTNHSYSIDIANKLSAISTHHLISSAKMCIIPKNGTWNPRRKISNGIKNT